MSNVKKKIQSLGQQKLQNLGVKLPLLPLTTAGSLPKHIELTELRYKVSKGVASPLDLDRREKLSIEGWLREQSKIGLDILVDGEMNRGDLITFFSRKIDGFTRGGTVRIYGNRYFHKPIIKGKLLWKEPLVAPQWQLMQRATQRTLKAVVTGPYTLMDCAFNEFYRTREEALDDLTLVIQKEVTGLIEAGAKIIQFDEMSLGARPHEIPLCMAALKNIAKNSKAYFVLRVGYENFSALWPAIEKFPVDNFYFEGANSNFSILASLKKFPTTKDITIGVVDSHSHIVEETSDIAKNIKQCLKVIPSHQLWIGTDSGLKTRSLDQATEKLTAMSRAVQKIRLSL